MEISNANPIQWWLPEIASFNNKQEIGIEHKDYCMPFNLEDTVRDQFREETDLRIDLVGYDVDEEEALILNYEEIQTGIYEVNFIPQDEDIEEQCLNFKRIVRVVGIIGSATDSGYAQNATADNDWSLVSDPPGVNFNVAPNATKFSEHLYKAITPYVVGQEIIIRSIINYAIGLGSGGQTADLLVNIHFLDGAFSVLETHNILSILGSIIGGGGSNDVTNTLTIPVGTVYISIKTICAAHGGFTNLNAGVTITHFLDSTIILGYSDCIDFKENHAKTRLLSYSNDIEYAGLDYTDEQFFNIRIKSKFYEPRGPEENESESLSDGTTQKLSSSTKEQKLLELFDLPPYMHKKIQLALQHNTIYIDNQAWVKEEAYEPGGLIHERYPFFDAKVYLTLKDSEFITNV